MCQERIWKLIVFNYVLRPPAIPGGFCASLKIKKLTSNIKKKTPGQCHRPPNINSHQQTQRAVKERSPCNYGRGRNSDLCIQKWSLPIDGGTALLHLSPLKPHASDTGIHSSCRLWQLDFPGALPPGVARDFWSQTKKENTLWQGVGSLWMQMSLGKFTEQLAGSEASVTSPPTRHSPRFAKRSEGFQGPCSKNRHTHGKGHGNPVAAAHCACHHRLLFLWKWSAYAVSTCHPQNGWWVRGFIVKHSSSHPSLCRICVTCITWHLPPLSSSSKDSKSNATWQVEPFISVILGSDQDSAAQTRSITQLLHTEDDHRLQDAAKSSHVKRAIFFFFPTTKKHCIKSPS